MAKNTTQSIAPRKPVVTLGRTDMPEQPEVVPSRLEPGRQAVDGAFTWIGENVLGFLDADGILTLRIDTAARLGRTKKGLGSNVTISGTGGAVALGLSDRLTLSHYTLAGFPDESGDAKRGR